MSPHSPPIPGEGDLVPLLSATDSNPRSRNLAWPVSSAQSVFAESRKRVSSSLGCQRQVSGSAGQGCCLRPSYPLDFAPGSTVGLSHARDTPLGASPICGQGWGRGGPQDPVFGDPVSPPRCSLSGWAQLEKRLAAGGCGCLGSSFPRGQFTPLLS